MSTEQTVKDEMQRRATAAPQLANAVVPEAKENQKALKEEHHMKLENLLLKRQLIEKEIGTAQAAIVKLEAEAKAYVDTFKDEYFPGAEQIEVNMASHSVVGKFKEEEKKEKK